MGMQVLERGMETHRGKWQVLRVAIVEIREFCYIGRVFFGNRETGEGAWDCDCRPSDAVWLAQKVHTIMITFNLVSRTPLSRAQSRFLFWRIGDK